MEYIITLFVLAGVSASAASKDCTLAMLKYEGIIIE